MGKLPSRTNRVSKGPRPQSDNDLSRTFLRVTGPYLDFTHFKRHKRERLQLNGTG